jgi:hypothetical protein
MRSLGSLLKSRLCDRIFHEDEITLSHRILSFSTTNFDQIFKE